MGDKHRNGHIALWSASVAIIAFALSTHFSLFERLIAYVESTHAWRELDIGLAFLTSLGSWLFFISARRSHQLRREIQRRESAERRAHASARHDPLTGLPNRLFFSETTAASLADSRRCAVLFIDLEGFKAVNDTYGHDVGDALLVEVGKRLAAAVPEAKQVARLGGDEFGVLIDPVRTDETQIRVTLKLAQAFSTPVRISGISVTIGLTIGVAAGTRDDLTAEDLIRAADLDMYERKRAGRFARPERVA